MRKLLWVLICAYTLVVALESCGKREVKIDRIMRRAIDTTAASRKAVLRPKLDSICDAQFDSLVQVAVDSILKQRRSEISKIIRE